MKTRRFIGAAAVLLLAPLTTVTLAASAEAKPAWTKNCKALNAKYPHGVGKVKAKDKTSGKRVTTFKKSTKLYNQAMSNNKSLDRDKDGIACEKK